MLRRILGPVCVEGQWRSYGGLAKLRGAGHVLRCTLFIPSTRTIGGLVGPNWGGRMAWRCLPLRPTDNGLAEEGARPWAVFGHSWPQAKTAVLVPALPHRRMQNLEHYWNIRQNELKFSQLIEEQFGSLRALLFHGKSRDPNMFDRLGCNNQSICPPSPSPDFDRCIPILFVPLLFVD